MKIAKGLQQAYDLQDFTFNAAMRLREELDQSGEVTRQDCLAIGTLVKAWETAQERIRIHRNKPLPGSRTPEKKKSSAQSRKSFPSPIPLAPPEIAPNAPTEAMDNDQTHQTGEQAA